MYVCMRTISQKRRNQALTLSTRTHYSTYTYTGYMIRVDP